MDDAELKHLQSWIGKQSVLTDTLPIFPVQALASAFDHSILLNRGDTLYPVPGTGCIFYPYPHTPAPVKMATLREEGFYRRFPYRVACGQPVK